MANTANRNYPLPEPSVNLSDDVLKLISSFNMIDVDISNVVADLNAKAADDHGHAIADVAGLATALGELSPSEHNHTLGGLSDVDASGAGLGYLIAWTATGWVATSPAAAIGAHQHAIADTVNLQDALDAKAASSDVVAKANNLSDLANAVTARTNLKMLTITQAAYDALTPPDADTLYFVEE